MSEGQLVVANRGESVRFSNINSCIAICVLHCVGVKACVHVTAEEDPPIGHLSYRTVLENLRQHLLPDRVDRVVVVGSLGTWNCCLEPAYLAANASNPFKFFPLKSSETRLREFYVPYFRREGLIDYEFDHADEERRKQFRLLIREKLGLHDDTTVILINTDQTMVSGVQVVLSEGGEVQLNGTAEWL